MRTALLRRVAGSLLLPPTAAAATTEETNTTIQNTATATATDTKSKLMGFQCNTTKQIGVLGAYIHLYIYIYQDSRVL